MDRLRDADTTLAAPNPSNIPPPGSINDRAGFFIDCDLEAGFLGTPFRAHWANMITECIRNAILKAGLPPNYSDWNQLGFAIEKISEKISERIAERIVDQKMGQIEFVQDGGNVTGTIKGGKFTLNAPSEKNQPPSPPVGVQEGVVVIGTGSGIRGALDRGSSASWDGAMLGIHNGAVGASGGDGMRCLYGGTLRDGSQPINFRDCIGLSVSQAPDPGKNWVAGYTNVGAPQFKITLDGIYYGKNTVIQAADYAEWFETLDGAPIAPGIPVALEGGKLRAARGDDAKADIIGVTRPGDTRAALIGNSAELHWARMYLSDEFGAPVWTETRDADGRVYRTQAVNPGYDPKRPYVPRSLRPEWALVGLLGQVPVLTGQPLGDRWRVMRPVSDSVILVYVR